MTKNSPYAFLFSSPLFLRPVSSKAESFASFSCSNYILRVINKEREAQKQLPFLSKHYLLLSITATLRSSQKLY